MVHLLEVSISRSARHRSHDVGVDAGGSRDIQSSGLLCTHHYALSRSLALLSKGSGSGECLYGVRVRILATNQNDTDEEHSSA